MKKIKAGRIVSALVAVAMVFTLMFSFINVAPVLAGDSEVFYQESARLVADNWSNGYIGNITLKVGDPVMAVDGMRKEIDPGRGTSPIIVQDRTLLPIRSLIEETGGDINYEAAQGKVTVSDDGDRIEMKINSNMMVVNGEAKIIDVAPIIVNDRTMLPIRAVSENLGYEVEWYNETQNIVLTKKFQTKRLIVKSNSGINLSNLGAEKILNGPDNVSVLQFASVQETQEAYNQLERLGNVNYVEPDLYLPPVDDLTGLANYSTYETHKSWGVERIGADKYANYLLANGKTQQVVVAVVDTGVDSTHSFLAGRVLSNGYNFVSGNTNTYDDHGHGTHVSGTIVDCTSGLDNVKILPVKVLDAYGSGTTLMVGNGVEYAADKSVEVINMSLGGGRSGNEFIDEKVQYAINRNVTVVVAAGNSSENADNHCPAHIREAITVSAFGIGDIPAYFTNYGNPPVDVGAPGVDITSSVPGGRYETWSGTSMASPHVAAAAAMYILNDPGLRPAAVQNTVKYYVDQPAGFNNKYGDGIINMAKAIPATNRSVKITAPQNNAQFTVGNNINISAEVVTDINRFWCGYKMDGDVNFTKISESTSNQTVSWDTTGLAAGNYTITYRIDNNENVLASDEVKVTLKNGEEKSELVQIKWSTDKVILDLNSKTKETVYLIGVYSDGTEKKLTEDGFTTGFTSSNPQVATVNNAGEINAVSVGITFLGYSIQLPFSNILPGALPVTVTSNSPEPDELVSLSWSPATPLNLKVGENADVSLIATYKSGATRVVTGESDLYSNNPGVASVSANGKITGVRAGQTTIYFNKVIASSVKVPRPLEITVTEAPSTKIVRIEWSQEDVRLSVGETVDLKLIAVYANGARAEITAECGLYAMDESVVGVTSTGKITANKPGTTIIWMDSVPQSGLDLPKMLYVTVSN